MSAPLPTEDPVLAVAVPAWALSRHRLRSLAATAGVRTALGGPLPHGRRIAVTVAHGAVTGERDSSARWRGRVLISESPAFLAPTQRERLHAAALALDRALAAAPGDADASAPGPIAFDFVLDPDGPAMVDVLPVIPHDPAPSPAPGSTGVTLSATITAGEPAGGAGGAGGVLVAGLITACTLPEGSDCALVPGDAPQLAAGTVIATVRIRGDDRKSAVAALVAALGQARLDGLPTNLHLLRQLAGSATFAAGLEDARALDGVTYVPPAIEIVTPGTSTSIQDWPGRLGYWHVGVPPSGPMDDLAFRLANRLVGNPVGTPGLECTLVGPTLRFHAPTIVALTGCALAATIDGAALPMWRAVAVPAGAVLRLGPPTGSGCRAYLAIRHGFDVPAYLGSRATFSIGGPGDLGGFGGHAGRTLRAGDWLPMLQPSGPDALAVCPAGLPANLRPVHARTWDIGVLEGPHAAPDFFTPADMDTLYATAWEVHHNSSRTGVRLIGPAPQWARRDGGDAGLHPSNLHDNAYAVGAIDFTGDMPILLGPDGPSLGGFVCPGVVIVAERWKLGQLRPGDRVRFVRLSPEAARARAAAQEALIAGLGATPVTATIKRPSGELGEAVIFSQITDGQRPELRLRRAGDSYVLVEYGPLVLDLALRLRVHLLMEALQAKKLPGIIDLTPGIRSLQIHHDPVALPQADLASMVRACDAGLPSVDDVTVPSRLVHLPLSWDDPAARAAVARYARTVRPDAPWCPSNLEFIRRINGLDSIEDVHAVVFNADYLVLGLGDVYLGAPVATPLDPRHRLVTTKYNPARTWTPQNAVGIGGAYMCIYGMEGPGGYQLVGRTVPVWNAWRSTPTFAPGTPWLLRFFDRIRFYPVPAADLGDLRSSMISGSWNPRIEDGTFSWREHKTFLSQHSDGIEAFRRRQRAAFAAERARWEAGPTTTPVAPP
jgi:urea carboxylase